MEWMKVIGDSIQYIENHMSDELSVDDIAIKYGLILLTVLQKPLPDFMVLHQQLSERTMQC